MNQVISTKFARVTPFIAKLHSFFPTFPFQCKHIQNEKATIRVL